MSVFRDAETLIAELDEMVDVAEELMKEADEVEMVCIDVHENDILKVFRSSCWCCCYWCCCCCCL